MKGLPFLTFALLIACCKQQQNRQTKRENRDSIIKAYNDSACQAGISQAEADLKKGVIGYYFGGIGIPIYADSLEKKYGILVHREGCTMMGNEACYNKIMYEAMFKKFGKDIIRYEDSLSILELKKRAFIK